MFNLIVDEYDGKTLSHDENNKQPFISPNPTTTNEETHKVHIISDFDMKEKNSENLEKRSCRPKNYMFCVSKIHKQRCKCFACYDRYNNNNNNKIKNLVSIIVYQNIFSREKIRRSKNYMFCVSTYS